MAVGSSSPFSRKRASWSGCSSRQSTALLMRLMVVSLPANSRAERTRGSPSASAFRLQLPLLPVSTKHLLAAIGDGRLIPLSDNRPFRQLCCRIPERLLPPPRCRSRFPPGSELASLQRLNCGHPRWNTEHLGDHHQRKRNRVVGREVHFAALDILVEQLSRNLPDRGSRLATTRGIRTVKNPCGTQDCPPTDSTNVRVRRRYPVCSVSSCGAAIGGSLPESRRCGTIVEGVIQCPQNVFTFQLLQTYPRRVKVLGPQQ